MEIGEAEIEALKGDYENSDLFSDAEKAAIRWAEVLTLKQYHGAPGEPPRSAAAMDALKQHYNEAQIVEISLVSGFFNMWNRFADGLQVDLEHDPVMGLIQRSAHVSKDDYIAFMRDGWWNHEEPGKSS